ncbi:hypothetical protein ABH926_008018 [Catenulispora sp. GP43]|uniref:hypothetical protein n=1 Tax=Catenulispora sp. GP43 TaxID=3156263 RepID=UPI003513D516
MSTGHFPHEGAEPEPGDALRSGLHARAGRVEIPPPPIGVVRQRAQRRRRRRGMVQGLSGLAATCAVVVGIVAWSPGGGDVSEPGPMNTESSSATPSRTPAHSQTPTPSRTPAPSRMPTPTTSRTTSSSDFLLASDLGAGWTGPVSSAPHVAPILGGSPCGVSGYFSPPMPVEPGPNKLYFPPHAENGFGAQEAIYTYAAGTGASVMAKARTALEAGCGDPQTIKLLASPSTVADEAIVFTAGGSGGNILVRSGDRVASAAVETLPPGQDRTASMVALAKQMAVRLTDG